MDGSTSEDKREEREGEGRESLRGVNRLIESVCNVSCQ